MLRQEHRLPDPALNRRSAQKSRATPEKTHITRIFARLDATNRGQLTIFAYEAGLVAP
jgi:hypothetical protein